MKLIKEFFDHEQDLSAAAAKFITDLAIKSISSTGRFVIALSGGKTPSILYNLLAHPPYVDELPWKNIFVFWSDERCVPADDESNNSNLARKMLLNHVPIPTENIFPVQVQMIPPKAAIQYEQMMKAFFKEEHPSFDLILLGMGEDGHTASLFPGTEKLWESTEQLVKEIEVPGQQIRRITFTPTLINNAKNVMFLVTGKNKARILNDVLSNKSKTKRYPVQHIKPTGKTYWYIDEEAGAILKL